MRCPLRKKINGEIIQKLDAKNIRDFDLEEAKEHIKTLLKSQGHNKKARELYRFFNYMEDSLQKSK